MPSFGINARVLTDFANAGREEVRALALQPDGKIIAAGPGGIARYLADGNLDATFNASGAQPGIIPLAYDPNDVIVQPDGRIVAAGHAVVSGTRDALLVRFTAAGLPDSTFGTNGVVTSNFKAKGKDQDTDEFQALAFQPNGRIVAAGRMNYAAKDGGWGVARYHPNGTLDTSFDGDGWVTTPFYANHSRGMVMALDVQPDGKIVAAGRHELSDLTSNDFAVARYQVNASLDAGFGTGGKVRTDFGPELQAASSLDEAHDLVVQPDGKIVVVGTSRANTSAGQYQGSLVRLTANGALDPSFGGGDGRVAVAPPAFSLAAQFTAVALQSDGSLVAVSPQQHGNGVARFLPDGSVDTSFDGDGWAMFGYASPNPTAGDWSIAVAVQPDGKVITAGTLYSYADNTSVFALARFNSDGTFDDLMARAASLPQVGTTSVLDDAVSGWEGWGLAELAISVQKAKEQQRT